MCLHALAATFVVGSPLERFPTAEFSVFLLQALFIGSLISLNLSYFSARLNNEKISRGIAACFLPAMLFFPNFGRGVFGRAFFTADPVITGLLIILAVSAALNVALCMVKRKRSSGLH